MEEKFFEIIIVRLVDFISKNFATTHGLLISFLLLYLAVKVKVSVKTQLKIQKWIGKLQYKLREKDLMTHHVFNREYAHTNTISNIDFIDKNKTLIFKFLLNGKVLMNLEVLRNIIEDKEIWLHYDKVQLRKYLNEQTVRMVEETDSYFQDKLIGKYEQVGMLIFAYVMKGTLNPEENKVGFEYFRNIRLKELSDRLDVFFEQDAIYSDNYKIMIGFFTEIDAGTVKAVEQTIQLFKYFNGGLSDILKQYYVRN